ncbi:SMI1/KNR4 family protein [Clostridium sp.]|uniref:SMI1/KNR4 family protein n=1 Tax=Clostridium sp. TaxID=1506 RepID=UPI00260C2C44|nr:SMI1/KNR4 family protein [Clostridium sp.]
MSNNLRWICENDNVEMETISKVEKKLYVKFPKDYIEMVMKNDGGYPKPNRFNLNGNEEVFNNLLSFDEEDCSNIINTYNDVSDRLVEKIIPFGEDPFGNLICFDYRNNDQPIVVFWEHERAFNDKESAITYVCDSFNELLLMLHDAQE